MTSANAAPSHRVTLTTSSHTPTVTHGRSLLSAWRGPRRVSERLSPCREAPGGPPPCSPGAGRIRPAWGPEALVFLLVSLPEAPTLLGAWPPPPSQRGPQWHVLSRFGPRASGSRWKGSVIRAGSPGRPPSSGPRMRRLNYFVENAVYLPGDPPQAPPRSWSRGPRPSRGSEDASHWDQLRLLPPVPASSSPLPPRALGRFHRQLRRDAVLVPLEPAPLRPPRPPLSRSPAPLGNALTTLACPWVQGLA